MPIHDWTRVDAGLFHHFHQRWTVALSDALNAGCLPDDCYALVEQVVGGPEPDIITLRIPAVPAPEPETSVGITVATTPPRTRYVLRGEPDIYARKANRIAIRHRHGKVIAIIEVVSPGNKDSQHSLRAFVEKATELLRKGIHLLIVDLFPPSKRDPQGIHKAIWDEIHDEPFELPPDKPLTLAAYSAGPVKVAYVEPVAVGDVLPDMPLFLEPEVYIPTPLEATYRTAWSVFPRPLQGLLDSPRE